MALGSIAGALLDIEAVGDTLNPIIKPIMESVKTQQNVQIQNYSIQKVPKLLELCLKRGSTHVAEKIVKNLTHFASTDIDDNHGHVHLEASNESHQYVHYSILSMKELKSETCITSSLIFFVYYKFFDTEFYYSF